MRGQSGRNQPRERLRRARDGLRARRTLPGIAGSVLPADDEIHRPAPLPPRTRKALLDPHPHGKALVALFRETAAAHHDAFRAVDGHDPEWPRWYAEYIVTRLPELGLRGGTETLAEELRRADAAYRTSGSQEPWQEFYARWFVEELRSEPRNGK